MQLYQAKKIIVSCKSPWLQASDIFVQLQFGLHVNAFLHVDVSWDLLSEFFEFPLKFLILNDKCRFNLPILAVRFIFVPVNIIRFFHLHL